MKTVELMVTWGSTSDFELGAKDVEGKLTYLGSKVWKSPELHIVILSQDVILARNATI